MRLSEREITDPAVIESVIRHAQVCRLAMARDSQPYLVPLCFGYEPGAIYLHCAREGMKLDFLRANSSVCFEISSQPEIIKGERACR